MRVHYIMGIFLLFKGVNGLIRRPRPAYISDA